MVEQKVGAKVHLWDEIRAAWMAACLAFQLADWKEPLPAEQRVEQTAGP